MMAIYFSGTNYFHKRSIPYKDTLFAFRVPVLTFISVLYIQNNRINRGVLIISNHLTHLSLASLLWDIGKQHSPRCDAAERGVPSGAILFAYRNFFEKWNKTFKITPEAPQYENGLAQMTMMGESIR